VHHDLRDIRGRLRHLAIATLVGIAGSLAITLILPTRDHFPTPPGGCGFSHQGQGWLVTGGDPVLMLAGVVAIALGVYAFLRSRRHMPRCVARYVRR
jgi:hypothetical protein